MTHAEAAAACRKQGGWLPGPETQAENDLIEEIVGDEFWHYWLSTVWLGIDDQLSEGVFMTRNTPTGSFLKFDAWSFTWAEQPSDGNDNNSDGEDCVAYWRKKWFDKPCSSKIRYICQVPVTVK